MCGIGDILSLSVFAFVVWYFSILHLYFTIFHYSHLLSPGWSSCPQSDRNDLRVNFMMLNFWGAAGDSARDQAVSLAGATWTTGYFGQWFPPLRRGGPPHLPLYGPFLQEGACSGETYNPNWSFQFILLMVPPPHIPLVPNGLSRGQGTIWGIHLCQTYHPVMRSLYHPIIQMFLVPSSLQNI